jgi:protein-disulfide isomerase/uncharacterized membrane protein
VKTRETIARKPELWQITCEWLRALGNKPGNNFCRDEITTHPDYPSLISVTDFLDTGGMAYKAVQADASYIHEFNYPLLAHIRQHGDQFMHMISNAAEWDKQKEISEHWTGIVIYPEKNSKWRNEYDDAYKSNERKNKITAIGFAAVALLLLILSTYQYQSLTIAAFGLFSLAGLTISIAALAAELGYQSRIVKQVCGVMSSRGCEQVLKSQYAKGFAGITPADASALYFLTQFALFAAGAWLPSLTTGILLFSLAGIPVAAWSIYIQSVKLKEFCALCIAIVTALILQSVIAFIQWPPWQGILPPIYFASTFIFLTMLLLPVKQLLKTNSDNKSKIAELKKWKQDPDLFSTLWAQERAIDTTTWRNDLLLGNPMAPLQITVACNPYCGPCASSHRQLEELLHRYPGKLKIQMRLLCRPEDAGDSRTTAVIAILQKAATVENNEELQQLFTDWFEYMDFDKWVNKWKPDTNINVDQQLKQHSMWVEQSNIAWTPTFFINGKQLPGRYSLNDLELLIPRLRELPKQQTV